MNFAQSFGINLCQAELDFVNVSTSYDTRLFVDPYALEIKQDLWSTSCADAIRSYFQELLEALRTKDDVKSQQLIAHLHEPSETFLGLSRGRPRGRGLGEFQGNQILDALRNSAAVETGVLNDLSESALFIENINRDKISDLTTNIIRANLIEYTSAQCELYNIPRRPYGGPPVWDVAEGEWRGVRSELPYVGGKPVLLVPKFCVRLGLSLKSQEFYNHEIEFLQAEHLRADTSLVRTLKNGTKRVFKSDLKERHPYSKDNLAEFAKRYPNVLETYKQLKGAQGALSSDEIEKGFDEKVFAPIVRDALAAIPAGRENASQFHNFSIGLLTFLFYPSLVCPVKEAEINQGRKRIDIRYTNAKVTNFFSRILSAPQTRALTVLVECKNYSDDIGNPELDQMAGRFNDARGWFGIVLCRTIDDKKLLLERCRDLARDGHGFIIVLGDADIIRFLNLIETGSRRAIDAILSDKLNELTA